MKNTDPMLESYLTEVDSHLSQRLPAGDKAEIITKIKNDILDLKEKPPHGSTSDHLKTMGEPRDVANRYLSERGLAPVPVSQKKNIIKWLVIGFLGTFALFLLFILILVFKFSSLVSMIDGSGAFFSFGETEESLPVDGVEKVEFAFVNGDIDIEFSNTQKEFIYSCEYAGRSTEEFTFKQTDSVIQAIGVPSLGVECDLTIPSGINLILNGQNADVDIKLDSNATYNVNAGVVVGQIKNLPQSDPTGVTLDVQISNGEIAFH